MLFLTNFGQIKHVYKRDFRRKIKNFSKRLLHLCFAQVRGQGALPAEAEAI